ncbi:MAG: ABC transporter permease subunit [Chloroflexi bacterium]|nr:MAG: ABC transporter permease subunit [Chloroflexota bacterium]
MADLSPQLPKTRSTTIPFWRDIRVLGVLAQIAFVIVAVMGITWVVRNTLANLDELGESQFICRDGTSSFRCAYDFMRLDAQFDIAETPIPYEPSDSYWRALGVAAVNTLKVTVLGVILATVLGTLAGIARLSSNWLVSNLAKWYVDLMRNTPLLLQLFFLYFSVILVLPPIKEAIQPFNLPIFFSQRGINIPAPVFMPSFAVWLAFVVLGIIQAQVLWIILGRQEELTGKSSNRFRWALVSFLLVVGIGWYVSGSLTSTQAIMTPKSLRVREFKDLQKIMLNRLKLADLGDIELALSNGTLTQEDIDAAAFRICAQKESASEVNLTSQLRNANIPYTVKRSTRLDQATEAYANGECEILVASQSLLAAEREALEDGANHVILPIAETPVRISIPNLEGLNFVGGAKLTPEFAAILIGLVLYTGGFIAEIVRAGIQAVPKGQSEAARALGLSESQRLRLIVLPQALRVIIPPITSQYLNLAKNSTLAQAIAFPDLWTVSYTTINQSGRAIQIMLIVMGSYLSLSLIISALLNWYNRRIALVER